MAMSSLMRRRVAIRAGYDANLAKPPTRRQLSRWLDPVRKSIHQIKRHEVDCIKGYAVTRLHDNDTYGVVHEAIDGLVLFINRLMPDVDTKDMATLSTRLRNGTPVEGITVDRCAAILRNIESRMSKIPRKQITDCARDTNLVIQIELMGLNHE